jgi:predicted type IV restriction endonuclease
VAELERQIELYRRAIDEYQGDNRDSQAKAILELDLVKRSDLNAALEKSKALQEGEHDHPSHSVYAFH